MINTNDKNTITIKYNTWFVDKNDNITFLHLDQSYWERDFLEKLIKNYHKLNYYYFSGRLCLYIHKSDVNLINNIIQLLIDNTKQYRYGYFPPLVINDKKFPEKLPAKLQYKKNYIKVRNIW